MSRARAAAARPPDSCCRAAPRMKRKFSPSRSRPPRADGASRGSLLTRHLGRLAALGIARIFLEVDEDNRAALRLYARAGFREVGRREGYYARARRLGLGADLAAGSGVVMDGRASAPCLNSFASERTKR